MSTILDIWVDPINTGIFTVLNDYDVPWKSDNIYDSLNTAYYYNHSGQKNISPLLSGVLGNDSSLSSEQMSTIGKLIFNICGKNWDYLWNALFSDYDPIENYNSEETETTSGSGNTTHGGSDTMSRSGSDTHTLSGSDSTKDSGTDTFTDSGDDVTTNTGDTTSTNTNTDGTSETVNTVSGFNSDEFSNDNKSITTVNQTVTDKREDNLTSTLSHGKSTAETKDMTVATTYGKSDSELIDISTTTNYNNTENRSDSESRTLKRHGNIGVTTSQQMIESEIELRKKNFFELVFNDIDHYMTISVY